MKNKLLILLATISISTGVAHSAEEHYFPPYAPFKKTGFKPSFEPIFNSERPKPNILMVLDDSGSMKKFQDTVLPEHYISFGNPICQRQSDSWHADRVKLGEYDPFIDGKYVPWDEQKAVNGLINGKKRPPLIESCVLGFRNQALEYTVDTIMRSYRDHAYIGISVLWLSYDDKPIRGEGGLLSLPIDDYSGLSEEELQEELASTKHRMKVSAGNTPIYPAVYEAIKMFRGQPMNARGTANVAFQLAPYKSDKICEGSKCYYEFVQYETPLRYRCQQNHMIVMTDGEYNSQQAFGIDLNDGIKLFENSVISSNDEYYNGVNVSVSGDFEGKGEIIGRLTSSVDLRDVRKPINPHGRWLTKSVDDAGKPWKDSFSVKMPIYTHSVSMFVDPLSPIYVSMTAPTKGLNLGFGESGGSATDLLNAFDKIFSTIIKTSSSTFAITDRKNANALEGKPVFKDGIVDMSTVGSIRYDTTFNFRQHTGTVRAMVPYISKYTTAPGSTMKVPVIETMELWDTDDTILPNSGRYLTLGPSNKQGEQFRYLDDSATVDEFSKIYELSHKDQRFNSDYIDWLMNFGRVESSGTLRSRIKPMGSITNSNIVLANKDELYVNVAKDRMTQDLSKDLVSYLIFKTKFQRSNLLIVPDNDGFVNFINAQRGIDYRARAGGRDTAYFPQLLAHRLDEIAKNNRNATLILEGKTNVTDAKVFQPNKGLIFATIGMTGMGAGGKGLVGYRLFAGTENQVVSQSMLPSEESDPIDKVLPLYEITNEGPKKYRTKGFEDLGYTYSGFEFFNQMEDKKWKSIAVFGNGYGVEKSVLYFINAYTGEKLHQITLNNHGGGASTPSIVVKKNPNESGQIVERIYVGDYSGNLYRVDFQDGDYDDDSSTSITLLFEAKTSPNNEGQSAITVKPLVTYDDTIKYYTVAFGTGIAESKRLDRGNNSLVEHFIYSIVDKNNMSQSVKASSVKGGTKLFPVVTLRDLTEGAVHYVRGSSVDPLEAAVHDLSIQMPVTKKDNGWYTRLIADGTRSGERTLQNPQYDPNNQSVVFNTWGIHEQSGFVEVDNLYDPCLIDVAFGKTLSLDLKTGAANNSSDVMNKGVTNNAYGGVTGNNLSEGPVGNTTTNLNDLDNDSREKLLNLLPEEDSSYAVPKGSVPVMCKGDISGDVICAEHIFKHRQLEKGRLHFHRVKSN